VSSLPGRPVSAERYFTDLGRRWDDAYNQAGPLHHGVVARQRRCLELLGPDLGGKRLLDLGCGTGAILPLLGGADLEYEGIDVAPTMVEATRGRIQALGLGSRFRVRQASAEALPFPVDHFDAVLGLGLLAHIDDPGPAIREALRVAKPGATLVFTTPRRRSLNHVMVQVTGPLRAALRAVSGHRDPSPRRALYSDAAFRALFVEAGALVVDERHYDKRVLPYPITRLWPGLARWAAALVEDWPGLTCCATGYAIACVKRGEAAATSPSQVEASGRSRRR
jgi:SAM-dependent methyltransferase